MVHGELKVMGFSNASGAGLSASCTSNKHLSAGKSVSRVSRSALLGRARSAPQEMQERGHMALLTDRIQQWLGVWLGR